MRAQLIKITTILLIGFTVSCSSGGDEDTTTNTQNNSNPTTNPSGNTGGGGDNSSAPPGSFSLTFPNNAEVCQDGAAVANQPEKLIINFRWTASNNANSYELSLIESKSGNEVEKIEASTTNKDITLDKGTLYSWSVKASNVDGEVNSSQWSFYSRGESTANYVPYPAYNIVFDFDTTNDLLTITWQASDEDGDTLNYNVAIFENTIEIYNETDLTNNTVTNIPVFVGGQYYAIISVNDGISTTSTTSQIVLYE